MLSRLAFYSTAVVLYGCASAPVLDPPPVSHPPLFGLGRVAVQSDVVVIPSEVEHVLYPASGPFALEVKPQPKAAAAPVTEPSSAPPSVDAASVTFMLEDTAKEDLVQLAALASKAPISDEAVALPSPSATEISSAWRKYCKVDGDITLDDWAIITSNSAPAELAAHWSKECVPLK